MSWQLNLDGFALPIKQLKGTEPVEKLDLSGKHKGLGVHSAIVVAKCIEINGALTQLDLTDNELGDEAMAALREIAESRPTLLVRHPAGRQPSDGAGDSSGIDMLNEGHSDQRDSGSA